MAISTGVQKLTEEHRAWQAQTETGGAGTTISVDEVAARVASFYEKIRGLVDWREEHLLRKTAIERILKRRMMMNKNQEDFAEHFLSELVRGGHFPNDRIPLEKIDQIQNIIDKYVYIIEHHQESKEKGNGKLEDWILSISAVEIEEALSNPRRERALITLMVENFQEHTHIGGRRTTETPDISEDEKSTQIFVAVQKALFKLDHATISYHLLERFYSDWGNPSKESLSNISSNLAGLHDHIKDVLFHPYSERLYQLAETYDTPYLIVNDIVSEDPDAFGDLLENPAEFEEAIRHAYNRRLSRLKGRIKRAAIYSTLSVFLSKIVIALAVEIPLEQLIASELNYTTLGISIGVPPFLMLLLVWSAQTTTPQNFERVMVEVMKISRVSDKKDSYKISPPTQRGGAIVAFVYLTYFFSFILSFGGLVWLLQKLSFSLFTTVVFIVFISLVSYAGTKIRQRARELMIEPERPGLITNIFDVLSLPMIQVGKWLSSQFIKYNVLVLMFNFLIEVPFQVFVEFVEQWRNFLKEKKEEIH